MKIGIITFQRAYNFGAVWQAYALLSTLKSIGHKVEIIDYWPKYRDGHYSLSNSKKTRNANKTFSVSNFKIVIENMLTFPDRWITNFKFSRFIKDSLEIRNSSYHSGSDTPDKYDVIICGSDQIWRYNFRNHRGFDEVYFAKYPLNTKVIKVSYGASMGDKDIDENAKKELSAILKNFDFISVREDSLLELIRPLTTKLPIKVLDPVFLIAEPEWRKMIKRNTNKKKYLLFYQLLQNTEAATLAKKIAKERQLEIIQIKGIVGKANPFESGNFNFSSGPVDFISLIAHADYVVSTSYHGVVFSILFRKPFSALGFHHNSYRIKSLLKSLGIEHCLIENNSHNHPVDINYTSVNIPLEEMIKDSLCFLRHSINNNGYNADICV